MPNRLLPVRLIALACLIACAAPAAARDGPVRVSVHEDGAQVVFAFARHVGFGMARQGDTLQLRFTGAGSVPDAGGDGRNVTAIRGGTNQAAVDLAPGARVHSSRQGRRIVLTVVTPVQPPPPRLAAAAAPPPPQPPLPPPAPLPPSAPARMPLAAAPPIPVVAEAPAPLAPSKPPEPDPPALAAAPAALPPGLAGAATLLPFSARVGAAAFRRNGVGWVVFDERRPIDLASMQDDRLLARTSVQLLAGATLLRIPLNGASELRLTHVAEGWHVAVLPTAPPAAALTVEAKPARLELAVADPSQVVAVADPDTGQNLLVGTVRESQAGVAAVRRVPAFVLQTTWQGVLVEPIADTTTLRVAREGFVLEAAGEALSPAPEAAQILSDAAFLTRRFAIPTGPSDTLFRRLQAQVAEAGAAPAQARGKPRKAAAATLVALGLGVEAQAMLHLAAEEDARLAADPEVTGLAAVAAMLGGRSNEGAGIADPALDGTDEVNFWRAVRAAQAHEASPAAAPVFAATVKLLLAYPEPLRHALLPLVAETMALGGTPDAADALLARLPDDPALDFARALRLEAKGNTAQALIRYDALAIARDRLTAARAASRATQLRLATKAIGPAEAADSLERQFFNWRGDSRELDLRMQVATLRSQTGAWRAAFALLHETAAMYPDNAATIQARMAEMMTELLSGPAATMTPLDLVALTEENAELVASVAPTQAAGLVADKLVALDLPRRAGPVLDRMMQAAPVGSGQATLGVRLAELLLADGDEAGARAALANSNAPDLPPPLLERRGLVGARLAARAGQTPRAVAILRDLATPAADDLRATLLTDAKDWPAAATATADLVAKTIPPAGPLTPAQQDTVLRLASALSRAKDDAGLRDLGARETPRIEGPKAGMFQLLTAAPVANVTDLPRSSSEMSLVKAIPGGLAAMGSR